MKISLVPWQSPKNERNRNKTSVYHEEFKIFKKVVD